MRLWPDSLVGRTVVILLAGVVLSNAIGIVMFSGERMDLMTSALGHRLAERVAATVPLMEEALPEERRKLIRQLRRSGARVAWSDQPLTNAAPSDWRTRTIADILVSQLGEDYADSVRIAYGSDQLLQQSFGRFQQRRGRHGDRQPGNGPGSPEIDPMPYKVLIGSLRLTDGSWLNFGWPMAAFRPFWETEMFAISSIITVVVLSVALWVVIRASRPLSVFAAAAQRLGLDVNAPPLEETGPREVRQASKAFNEMQRRIQTILRDRSQMLAAMSHDLRTPITRLRLRAEFVEDDEQQRKMIADLDDIEAMIAHTLAFAREDYTDEAVIRLDLADLLRTVVDDAAEIGAEVSYTGPETLAFYGRSMGLKRAFTNLIDNAIQYGRCAHVELSCGPDAVTVTVDDDGPGIPESELQRVFQPFYRLDPSRSRDTGGVGLGLAVVRLVIAAHGGRITLRNRESRGLRAEVAVPRGGTESTGERGSENAA